jgi:oxysterol-binding protein 1
MDSTSKEKETSAVDRYEPSDEDFRFELPFKKDGTVKISLWEVLKNSIGKDIWRISVPVFFNQPLGVLQSTAGITEYLDLLD